ncbi:reverse transcriptase [Phytophthora megakarya]|uniref:Reverse transcriptase n=1 Tax=Phytophthora megakarya TaxID=4795 RepID=A0A225VPI9_9STRA|nr:reverse transcriptase [Phytophthora megakarya]
MTYKVAREAWRWADHFVLSSDNALNGQRKVDENTPEMSLRLVVPTTRIQVVQHNCHGSIERGHQSVVRANQRVKHDCYWIDFYADMETHVKPYLDSSSSNTLTQLKGYSPGNYSFTGFVITKAMSGTDALTVTKVFEECTYRRFGAPSIIRHHRERAS